MYTNVTFGDFCDLFRAMGREDQFSYQGKRALFNFLEEQEADLGERQELDVIALCCDFVEYDSIEGAEAEYGTDDLRDQTTVIDVCDGGVIVLAF